MMCVELSMQYDMKPIRPIPDTRFKNIFTNESVKAFVS